MTEIEIWADSFHEGQWASENIGREFERLGARVAASFDRGFQPVFRITYGTRELHLRVFGSYRSWDPLPRKIKELLAWGKPDFLAYDAHQDQILFAVEETAAVPTGNQALQRCERMFGAARAGIPYWYLLPEYGLHIDGGVRRDSIWPTLMALTLTVVHRTPCVVLHFGSADRPEDYTVGIGPALLFRGLARVLANVLAGRPPTTGMGAILADQYADMLRFLSQQWDSQIDLLPNVDRVCDKRQAKQLAAAATKQATTAQIVLWPRVADLPEEVRKAQTPGKPLKPHPFAEGLEASLERGLAWRMSSRTGSRPQPERSIRKWLAAQRNLFDSAPPLNPPAFYPHQLRDFPVSQSGRRHVTTAPSILYLFDRWYDLRLLVERSFERLKGRMPTEDPDKPALVYVCNSLKPGRLFGDPFTGQLAAYATIFAEGGRRLVLAWYPHQAHYQAIKTGAQSKGLKVMREVVDFALFAGGVVVCLRSGEVI